MVSFTSLRAAWPVLAAAISLAMLATAHAFESFGHYSPCGLCLRQREVYWGALTLAVVGLALVRLKRLSPRALALLLAAVFAAGTLVAAFHAGVEWKWWPGPKSCTGLGAAGAVDLNDLSALLKGAKVRPPSCDEAAWRMFGISMAGYNAMVSLGLTALGLIAAFAAPAASEPRP